MSNIYTSADQLIGKTPLLELTQIEKNLGLKAKILAKLEFLNPAGSVKDRVAKAMLDAHITYLNPSKGHTLYAESECVKAGRRTCSFLIHVTDDLGTKIADVTINGVRV